MIKKFSAIGNFDYTIVGQKAGVRPTTKDRRPLVGEHPELKNMFILYFIGFSDFVVSDFDASDFVASDFVASDFDASLS